MCKAYIRTTELPIKPKKIKPVVSPARAVNKPIKASSGDKAETNTVDPRIAAAGQRKEKKRNAQECSQVTGNGNQL